MTNLDRLKLELQLSDSQTGFTDEQLTIYLLESNLVALNEYSVSDNLSILKSTLAVLNAIANSTEKMKSYKTEDISVADFAENLQSRIEQLDKKIKEEDFKLENSGATIGYLFSS